MEVRLSKIDMQTYSCAWTVTGSATKLKTGNDRLKKPSEHLRTLNASQTTDSMRNNMHASTVRTVFGLPLTVLHFEIIVLT